MNTTTSAPTSLCEYECEYNEYYSISTCRKLNEFICAPITRHLIPIQEQFENVSKIKQFTVSLSLSLPLSHSPSVSRTQCAQSDVDEDAVDTLINSKLGQSFCQLWCHVAYT